MDSEQQGKLTIITQVTGDYEDKKASYSTVPALAVGLEQLIANRITIEDLAQKQMREIKGAAIEKADFKGSLANRAFKICSGMSAWASATNNRPMAAQVSMSKSAWRKLNDNLLVPACRNVYDLANTNLAELAAYGITAEVLKVLLQAINDYKALISQPRKEILARGRETIKLKEEFDKTDVLFGKILDSLVEQLEETEPDTYRSYQAARQAPRSGGGKKATTDKPTPPSDPLP